MQHSLMHMTRRVWVTLVTSQKLILICLALWRMSQPKKKTQHPVVDIQVKPSKRSCHLQGRYTSISTPTSSVCHVSSTADQLIVALPDKSSSSMCIYIPMLCEGLYRRVGHVTHQIPGLLRRILRLFLALLTLQTNRQKKEAIPLLLKNSWGISPWGSPWARYSPSSSTKTNFLKSWTKGHPSRTQKPASVGHDSCLGQPIFEQPP